MKRILSFLLLAALAQPSFGADSLPVATQQVRIVDSTGATTVQVSANNGVAIGNGLTALVGLVNSTLPSYTAGRVAAPSIDLGGRVYITGDASMGVLKANTAQINGTATDVNTGNATAGTQRVVLASNQPSLAVSFGAPTGAAANVSATLNIAGGTTTAAVLCKTGLAISQPVKLYKVVVSAAVAARCVIRYNDNGSFTNWGVVQTSVAAPNALYDCNAGFCALTTSSTVTTQQIEANCTNYDQGAQDFTCSVQYCQAASGC
jgi:hypothetical protein